LKISYVTTETLIILKDALRKYDNLITEFAPFLTRENLDQISDS